MREITVGVSLVASLLIQAAAPLHAQVKFTPEDVGQTVNGFQDDFNGATRDPNWVPVPPEKDNYDQMNGVLVVTVVGEGAFDTHLLYEGPGYSDTVQEILARIRVTAFGTGDAPRCGVAVAVNGDSSQGINLHFRDHTQDGLQGRQFKLLDDRRAWGPRGLDLKWEDSTWYWLRLRQTGAGAAPTNNLNAKVWLADGSVPEPGEWQMNWRRSGRTGFAGIVGSSIGGLSEYEVDYILIKAEGLPSIKVSPAAFPDPFYLSIRQQPKNASADVGQAATFTIEVASSGVPVYQWQKAAAESTNFVAIAGTTAKSYTTPPLSRADHGAKFRCVLALGGATVTSAEATLTVDVTPPTVVRALATVDRSFDHVTVMFSEPVTARTATNAANYAIAGLSISSARLSGSGTNVVLKTGALTPGTSYTLTVNGIQDMVGNRILPNSQVPVSFDVAVPADFGQSVKGFQDDFTSATRGANWMPVPLEKDNYEPTNGVLRVTVVGEGPDTHLIYQAPGYSEDAQEVLARIRITAFGTGDAPRCGISVGVDPDSSQGINLHFRDHDQDGVSGRQFKLLDDRRAWGPPGLDIDWENETWYWLRLRQTSSIVTDGPNIMAKVWSADGTVPEPADWQMRWTRAGRIGFAGIVGSSIGGLSEYEVDYILIKAEGLPNIKVGSSAFPATALMPPAPRISAARSGNAITLTWTEGGVLESADSIAGPWSAVTAASSPHTAPFSGAGGFYRVRK
jgi:hypothetical protein